MATQTTIILNTDGSVKNTILGGYLIQGNNLVDTLSIGVDGLNDAILIGSANFELPNDTTNSLVGSYSTTISDDDGSVYNGFNFVLTQAQTLYAGDVKVSIRITNASSQILYSYQITLTINPSSMVADEQQISDAQWNSLMSALATYQQKFTATNVRGYQTLALATADLTNLAVGQIVIYPIDTIVNFASVISTDNVKSFNVYASVDISNYYTKTQIDSMLSGYLPLTGGVVSGATTFNGNNTYNGANVHNATATFNAGINIGKFSMDAHKYHSFVNVNDYFSGAEIITADYMSFIDISTTGLLGLHYLVEPTIGTDAVTKNYADAILNTPDEVLTLSSDATASTSGVNDFATGWTGTIVFSKYGKLVVVKAVLNSPEDTTSSFTTAVNPVTASFRPSADIRAPMYEVSSGAWVRLFIAIAGQVQCNRTNNFSSKITMNYVYSI